MVLPFFLTRLSREKSITTSPTECHLVIALADIAAVAQIAQALSSREMFDMVSEFYEFIGGILERAGGKVVKFMGDAALVVSPGKVFQSKI